MASQRDIGLQTLQSGEVAAAIQQLQSACAADPADYQAHIYLGAAYSQANQTLDAINVLTKAVELQPGNAQARYNLGIAMERGGYLEQAITAHEQAIALQPEYPKAREALQRLRLTAAPPPAHEVPPPYGGAGTQAFSAPVAGGAPPAPMYDVSRQAQPPYPVQQPQIYPPATYGGAPASQPPYQAPPQGLAGYGATPAPTTPFGAPLAAPPGSNPYGAPMAPSPYGSQSPQTMHSPTPVAQRNSGVGGGIGMALLFGLLGGMIGTALWVSVIMMTHYSVSFVGLGVGLVVGFLIKKGMGGPSTAGGIAASVITVLSSIAGNVIATAILHEPIHGYTGLGFSIAGIFFAYRAATS